MKRIMLDLESLSSKPNAAVVSIGAVEFDLEHGIGYKFYNVLETESQVRDWGRDIDPNTFAWWLKQSAEARAVFNTISPFAVGPALTNFSDFVSLVGAGRDVEMWGNGADFDCVVLGSLYETIGKQKPWSFRMNRCFRTLKNLGIPLGAGEGCERVGTAHNAVDDAVYQAHYAIAYLRRLPK